MFTTIGSSIITVIFLLAAIAFFAADAPVMGVICIPFILVFGIAAFVQWADMTNV